METFYLKNGIKVIFKQTATADIVSLKISSPISVYNENIEKSGVTNLMYCVMNKSTKNRTSEQLANDIENLGAYISTDVEYDFSGFTLNCMSQYFDKSCEILSDIILNPAFDQNEIEKEKQLILQTIKARTDSIKQTANDKFIKDFYVDNHPYSNIKQGSVNTINSLKQEDLIDVYNKVYSCKKVTITIVGNITKSETKKILEKYFSKLNLVNEYTKNIDCLYNDKNIDGKAVEVNSKFNQAFIIYAYKAPNVLDKDFPTLKMISYILGSRMTGRLFIELREKLGLAYEVNAIYSTRKDLSFFEVYIGLDKKNIDITKNGIEKIMNDLCETEIGEEELKNTKSFIKGIYLLDHQTIEKQAYYLALREMLGLGYEYDDKYIELLESVTSKDIIECSKKYFKQTPYKLVLNNNK